MEGGLQAKLVCRSMLLSGGPAWEEEGREPLGQGLVPAPGPPWWGPSSRQHSVCGRWLRALTRGRPGPPGSSILCTLQSPELPFRQENLVLEEMLELPGRLPVH